MHRVCVAPFLVALMFVASCGTSEPTPTTPPVIAPAPAPAPTAAVSLGPVHQLVVKDLAGKDVSLSTFAGRPMIIEIWATWCGPCRVNRANVQALKGSMPARIAVVGISVDSGASLVTNFLKSNHANEIELMATPAFMEFIRAINPSNSIPKTLYVDSKGRVADLAEGVQSQQWLAAMAKNLK
jgi:thiol-disulfide isomerase/thioredoxin